MSAASICFEVEGKTFATRIDWVQEVVPVGQVTPMPTAPPEVLGVTQVRGQVMPILDLPRMLGGRATVVRLGDAALFVRIGETSALLCGAAALSVGKSAEGAERIDLPQLLDGLQRRTEERPR